jgi:uncharacterized membrane protein
VALTAAERQLLDELEKTFTQDDPRLAQKLSAPPRAFHPANLALGSILFLIGIAALLVGMSQGWWISVLGFVAMLTAVILVVSVHSGGKARPTNARVAGGPRPVKPDLMARLQQRWNDRANSGQ